MQASLRWNDGGARMTTRTAGMCLSLCNYPNPDCQSFLLPSFRRKPESKKTRVRALPGGRILRAFINAAEAMQIAVAAGLFAGRADGGLAVAVVLREAR